MKIEKIFVLLWSQYTRFESIPFFESLPGVCLSMFDFLVDYKRNALLIFKITSSVQGAWNCDTAESISSVLSSRRAACDTMS